MDHDKAMLKAINQLVLELRMANTIKLYSFFGMRDNIKKLAKNFYGIEVPEEKKDESG